MKLTNGQQHALEMFSSGKNLLLLGDSGTGKSTLVSAIVKEAQAKGKKVAMTASTGIAAQLIGGRTVHSLLRAYPGMSLNGIDYAKKVVGLEDISVLIIDEISMIGSSFIEYLYNCLNCAGHHIQLVVVGDFFQLPPVKDAYAFTSSYWKALDLTPCILTEIIRQKDADFIHNIRLLQYGDKSCLDYLLSHSSPTAFADQISICAKRRDAWLINKTELDKLDGPTQIYMANYEGQISESDLRVEKSFIAKKGMRVMCVVNGPTFSNGSLGTITSLGRDSVQVLFDNGQSVNFGKVCFSVERKDILGRTTDLWQIPLCPAYAITIHKSQGQTFRYINIDGTKCWAPGQLYVAVSRATCIEGIHFLTPIKDENIKTDSAVIEFYKGLEHKL